MSAVLETYLEYMASWKNESDVFIAAIIDEYNYFLKLGDFESDSIIDKEFATLVGLAEDAKEATLAADTMSLAADATTLTAMYSFGLSMGAFAFFEANAAILYEVAATKAEKLNDKMATIDEDIAANISEDVTNWVTKFKENNVVLAAKSGSAVDGPHSRAILLKFITAIVHADGSIDNQKFKDYAESCSQLLADTEKIDAIYQALDNININGLDATDDDIADVLTKTSIFTDYDYKMLMVKAVVLPFMNISLKINHKRVKKIVEDRDINFEFGEKGHKLFRESMNQVEAFCVFLGILVTILDIVLTVANIGQVTKKCNEIVDKLNNDIKKHYKDFFNGIRTAALGYAAAIADTNDTSEDLEA